MKLILQDINTFDNAKDFLVDATELTKERMIELQNIVKWNDSINGVIFHMYIDKNSDSVCDISVFDGLGGWTDNIKATNEEINQVNDFLCTIKEYRDYCNNEIELVCN